MKIAALFKKGNMTNLGMCFKSEMVSLNRTIRNIVINTLPDMAIANWCLRPAIARLCGTTCAAKVILEKGIFYGNPRNLQIGYKSTISRGAFLDGFDKIIIGNNVGIAFQVTFITSTHELGDLDRRVGALYGKPIVIGDGVWIGARAIIGPGVEIGEGSMIAAGAVLMHSVPPNSLVAGNPGRLITRLVTKTNSKQDHGPQAVAPGSNA